MGFVHCDIKPDNIMLGLKNKKIEQTNVKNAEFQTYLIDFGLSHSYLKENKDDHIDKEIYEDAYENFKGNLMFSSRYTFMGYIISRRDDVISVIYTLIFLLNGTKLKINPNTSMRKRFEQVR